MKNQQRGFSLIILLILLSSIASMAYFVLENYTLSKRINTYYQQQLTPLSQGEIALNVARSLIDSWQKAPVVDDTCQQKPCVLNFNATRSLQKKSSLWQTSADSVASYGIVTPTNIMQAAHFIIELFYHDAKDNYYYRITALSYSTQHNISTQLQMMVIKHYAKNEILPSQVLAWNRGIIS